MVSEFGRKRDLEAIQAKGHDSYGQGARNSLRNTQYTIYTGIIGKWNPIVDILSHFIIYIYVSF